jgi:sigma-54-interacting transcriptional regulator
MTDDTHATDFEALHEVCLHRVNLLLLGAAPRLDALLARIRNLAETPIPLCSLPGPLTLPAARTVVVRDIAALTRDQQWTLLDWMNARRHRVQIISATTERLFAQVTAGLFSEPLYYRLNMVLVHV